MFVLRQLQEKCQDQNKGFVDLAKRFDTVSRQDLYKILEHLGCIPNCFNMVIWLNESNVVKSDIAVRAFHNFQQGEAGLCPDVNSFNNISEDDAEPNYL